MELFIVWLVFTSFWFCTTWAIYGLDKALEITKKALEPDLPNVLIVILLLIYISRRLYILFNIGGVN